jgi:hypothetical protein
MKELVHALKTLCSVVQSSLKLENLILVTSYKDTDIVALGEGRAKEHADMLLLAALRIANEEIGLFEAHAYVTGVCADWVREQAAARAGAANVTDAIIDKMKGNDDAA